jgi:hypothetical protein
MDIGCHYSLGLSGGYGIQSSAADFNWDGVVDLEDVVILAEQWLAVVFDEYRLCSLCNLHTGGDPNDPNAPDGREVIDANDMAAFMAEWGVSTDIECRIAFETADSNSVEPNQLSGVITIHVEDCLPSTWMFVQVDGMPAGETYADTGMPLFTIPTYEFSNGYHLLTIGGYTHQDGCWIQEFPAIFDNRLYYASIPDMYEPNEVYEVTGFFEGGTVEISTDPNSSTVSDNGYIHHSAVISTPSGAEATLSYEDGQSSEIQTYGLLASVDLSKKDPNSWRAVIIAPCEDINDAVEDPHQPDNRLISAIRETLEQANIPYEFLLEKNANWDNIRLALTGPNLNYVYWIGHMNSYVGTVQRTSFMCWNKRRFRRDEPSTVISWVRSDDPAHVPALPGDWDTRGHSMWTLRLWQSKQIKEFWAIGCESSRLTDMAQAVGVYHYLDGQHHTHIYVGNKIDVTPGGAKNLIIGYPSALSKIIRRHRTTHLGNALVTNDLEPYELYALWGNDRDKDGSADNTLQWWPSDIELFRVIFQ